MNSRSFMGLVLILLGAVLFLNRGETFGAGSLIGIFWPTMFVIPIGLLFHWMYFSMMNRKGVGLLVPGGILFTAGVVCQISMIFDSWGVMWPGFLLAVAVGLFELYWFGGRVKGLLIPVYILGGLSLVFFAVFSVGSLFNHLSAGRPFIAIAMIIVGLLALFGQKKRY